MAYVDIPLLQDTFTEASDTTLASHTPDFDDIGLGWQKVGNSGAGTNLLQVSGANDNLIPETPGTSNGVLYSAGAILHDNIYIQGRFISGTTDDSHTLWLRIDDDASEYYVVRFTSSGLQLVKSVAGSPTTLATASAPTSGQMVRFEIIDDVLKVYVNGRVVIKVRDTDVPAQGIFGYGQGQLIAAGDDLGDQQFDDFEVGYITETADFKDESQEAIDTELSAHTPDVGDSWDEVLDVSGGSMFADSDGYIRAGGITSDGSLYRANLSESWQNDQYAQAKANIVGGREQSVEAKAYIIVEGEGFFQITAKANIRGVVNQSVSAKGYVYNPLYASEISKPTFGAVELPFPDEAIIEPIWMSGEVTTLGGKTRRDVMNRKYRYTLRWEYMSDTHYNNLESEINGLVEKIFIYQKWPQSLSGVLCYGSLSGRRLTHGVGDTDFFSSVTLTLIEVNSRI